ncbi:ATP-binding cassette domain-containing protein [Paenibacillus arenosi]|uniref:Energy-coupling factor transporter ATPase n=1 Tax=Paenibacillus arenosi TaxID=2774142 RepID=A0ABR9AW58_9BACL|nr:ATP-binding cassette domain-containing protein [Paenibacillus arenosi]MBD8498116.1 energy-coupling factor transporter ATPase [Paenibacillus arenosi]
MAIVSSEKLSYQYEANGRSEQPFAIKDISFEWEQGQFYAILGSAGSGKSTLLQHVNGIFQPTTGRLRVLDVTFEAGIKQKGLKPLRKRVGLVFQFPEQQLFADTVEQDLMFGPLQFGMSEQEARQAALEALRTVGLPEAVLTMNPFQLSGGQMRKAAIAAVLASNPDLLVLDEPTATLDPISRIELLDLLHRLTIEQGKTVAVVTHRLDEVLPVASHYMLMQAGRLVFQGIRTELLAQPLQLQDAGIVLPAALRLGQLIGERCREQLDVSGEKHSTGWKRALAAEKVARQTTERSSEHGVGADQSIFLLATQAEALPLTAKEWAERLIHLRQQELGSGRGVVDEDSGVNPYEQQLEQSADQGANVYYAVTGGSESAHHATHLPRGEEER